MDLRAAESWGVIFFIGLCVGIAIWPLGIFDVGSLALYRVQQCGTRPTLWGGLYSAHSIMSPAVTDESGAVGCMGFLLETIMVSFAPLLVRWLNQRLAEV